MSTLETIDIPGVDILAAGGPYFGSGSAKGGDHYTVADLQGFAANAAELAGEVRPAIKLGHSPEQALLRESGLFDEHGQPAAGWLENLRVEGDKLYADMRGVPAKLAALIKAGAFRTRSVEQRVYTSQRTGKKHGWVIDGLALLGGKAPAVRTLDDIVALYSSDGDLPELDGEAPDGVRTITFAHGSIPVSMAEATLTLSSEQTAALAKSLGVKAEDLAAPEKLLAAIESATKTAVDAAVAKITPDLETAKKSLADAEGELKTLKAAAGAGESETSKELAETLKKLSADAEVAKAAVEKLRVMERDATVDSAIRGFKLEPAQREHYVKLYDAAPDLTKQTLAAMPKRSDLVKTFGSDDDRPASEVEAAQAEEDAMVKQLEASLGIKREAVTA